MTTPPAVPSEQPKTFKILADGTCAYCYAYRATWLSDCDNPIHTQVVAVEIYRALQAQVATLQKQWHDAAKLDADMDYVKDILDLKAQVTQLQQGVMEWNGRYITLPEHRAEYAQLQAKVTALEAKLSLDNLQSVMKYNEQLQQQLATAKALLVLAWADLYYKHPFENAMNRIVLIEQFIAKPITDADLAAARKVVEEIE